MKAPPYTSDRHIDLTRRASSRIVIGMLALSAVLVAVAPLFMADSYNWIEHTTSESAAQAVANAWIARSGFVLLGFAVILLAGVAGRRWGLLGRAMHRAYGVAMIGTAVFASMPWEDVAYVQFEDTLHSWASGLVGFCFIAGVLAVLLRRPLADRAARAFDWLVIAAAAGITPVVLNADAIAGLVQRIMFLVAYAWFAMEAIKSAAVDPHTAEAMAERMAA